MAPKRATKPKLHQKCAELPRGTKLYDTARKLEIIVDKEIGQGGFGRIYSAHISDKKEQVIVKIEPHGNGPLFVEQGAFTNILKNDMMKEWCQRNAVDFLGLPHLIASSTHDIGDEKIRFLAMPKYKISLDEILKARNHLSTSDAFKIAKGILTCLNYMHDQDYVHADLKPGNIMFNSDKKLDQAVLIDFGLAKKKNDNEVEKEDKKKAHNGTPLFTSTDAHRGCNPSYRADLEILAHNLVYWLAGSVPWIDQAGASDLNPVLEAKLRMFLDAANELKDLIPDKHAVVAIAEIYQISHNLPYNAKIDFHQISQILDAAIHNSTKTAGGAKKTTAAIKKFKAK